MFHDKVHEHLAVIVGFWRVSLFDEVLFQCVRVGYVAVVRAHELFLAGDMVRFAVGISDCAIGCPTYLPDKTLAAMLGNIELFGKPARCPHLFDQGDCFPSRNERRADRNIPTVLKAL